LGALRGASDAYHRVVFGRRSTKADPDFASVASAYCFEGRIILEGSTGYDLAAYTPTDLLVSVDSTARDEDLGSAILSVLDQFGKWPQASSDKALLDAVGVSSRTRLAKWADAALIIRPSTTGEISMRPYHPEGWYAAADDPDLACDGNDPAETGRILRQSLDAAASLRSG
jgi:hypothetical protein